MRAPHGSLRRASILGLSLCLGLSLTGCPLDPGDFWPPDDGGGDGGIHVTTVAELPDRSAEDYGDNTHGLITGETLERWRANWQGTRPRGISGRLVVLQVSPNLSAVQRYVAHAEGVVSYLVPTSSLVQTRANGLSEFEAEIPDGPSADAFLKRYGIDPRQDLIVLTFEQLASTQSSIVQSIGRAWLLLRYWGAENRHLAILNGSIDHNQKVGGLALENVSVAGAPVAPDDGEVTVKDLGFDNTALVVTVDELVDILRERPGVVKKRHVRIIDARGGAEALGLKKATSTGRTDCPSYDANVPANRKCTTPFDGRIKGARSVPWTQFLDTAGNGFRFFDKAKLKSLFDSQSGYDATAKLTIQYCRTNQRSTVTGLVASVVLGYPTRFYETSFIEWGHLAHGPTANTQVVSADFAFRTDVADLTEHAELSEADAENYVPGLPLAPGVVPARWVDGPNYNDDRDLTPISESWPPVDHNASSADEAVATDRAYLRARP